VNFDVCPDWSLRKDSHVVILSDGAKIARKPRGYTRLRALLDQQGDKDPRPIRVSNRDEVLV